VDQRKRFIYVGSMSGKVFLIDYNTKTLDQTFNNKDSAILSIAVNEEFCVTGSGDNFVRVWHPDLGDPIVESQHK
jgi:WD40 repeat protein